MTEIISRDEAKAKGLTRFFDGAPCKRGHTSERRTCDGKCMTCLAVRLAATAERRAETQRQRYLRNKAMLAERAADRRARPDVQERDRAYRKQRRSDPAVKETARLQALKWCAENRERRRETVRKWRAENPDKMRAQNSLRRARRYASGGRYTADDVNLILELHEYQCANPMCKVDLRDVQYDVDHIVPLVAGGSNDVSNLQPMCTLCNQRKGALAMQDFLVKYFDRFVLGGEDAGKCEGRRQRRGRPPAKPRPADPVHGSQGTDGNGQGRRGCGHQEHPRQI